LAGHLIARPAHQSAVQSHARPSRQLLMPGFDLGGS